MWFSFDFKGCQGTEEGKDRWQEGQDRPHEAEGKASPETAEGRATRRWKEINTSSTSFHIRCDLKCVKMH